MLMLSSDDKAGKSNKTTAEVDFIQFPLTHLTNADFSYK